MDLESLILDAGLFCFDSSHGNRAVFSRQEPRRVRVVREAEDDGTAPGNSKCSKNEILVLPGCEAALNVTNTKDEQTTEKAAKSRRGVPDRKSQRLF